MFIMQIGYNAVSHGPHISATRGEIGITANNNTLITGACFMTFSCLSCNKRILKQFVDRQEILRRSTIALLSSLFAVLWILPLCHPGTNLIGFTPF